mmetsp:Transcript_14281/g.34471  ORF Transcript_14281/g.34471 Transcript_14281/m.34471 type:complete len:219 (-) Transcript_14281:63-719(-)
MNGQPPSNNNSNSNSNDPNDFGHYFVEVGVIVVRDHSLYVYEHEEWEVDGALAASRLQIDLENADAIECLRFKSGSRNYKGGRVTITGIADSPNGDGGSGSGADAANNGACALERITFLFEYEDYKAIRPLLRPFMQIQSDTGDNVDNVDRVAIMPAPAPAGGSHQQPWLVRIRNALLPLSIFFARLLLFTGRALLLAAATAVRTLWLEFCRHFNNNW